MKFTKARCINHTGELEAAWSKVDIVLAGTTAIRAVDECETSKECRRFLPQEECESDTAYKNKLSRAVLLPFYENGVNAAVGVVCGTGIIITVDDDDAEFDKEFLSDVDGEGSSFEVFIRRMCHLQIHHGAVYCYMDKPGDDVISTDPDFDMHRPYVTLIKETQLLNLEYRRLGAVETLTLFEWEYCSIDSNTKYKKKLHIIIRDDCEDSEPVIDVKDPYEEYSEGDVVWTLTKPGCDGAPEEVTHGLFEDIKRIPIVTAMGNKEGPHIGAPEFESLCDMNIDHYQMTAALKSNLYMTSAPMRVVTGMSPRKRKEIKKPGQKDTGPDGKGNEYYHDIEISPGKLWWLGDKDAKVQVLESNGAGSKSITEYLVRLEKAMDDEIASFNIDKAQVTATATVTKTIEVKSRLETVKDGLISAINSIIIMYEDMSGREAKVDYVAKITSDVQPFLDSTSKGIIESIYNVGGITSNGYVETLEQFLPEGIKLIGKVDNVPDKPAESPAEESVD